MDGVNQLFRLKSFLLKIQVFFTNDEQDVLYELLANRGGDQSLYKLVLPAEDTSINGLNAVDLGPFTWLYCL